MIRPVSETKALEMLARARDRFTLEIREKYEGRARRCDTCLTPGACCLDAHFVNVHISRLDAVAIRRTLDTFEPKRRDEVLERAKRAVTEYGLDGEGDTFEKKYACPLYEPATGCLVHDTAKPTACIAHACYDSPTHLPPGSVVAEQERRIDALNELAYRRSGPWLPLPLAITVQE